jgi:hypothetical protein
MALSNQSNKVSFSPSADTTSFSFTFPYYAASDISADVLEANGTSTTITAGVGFSLTANNGDTALGGTVDTSAGSSPYGTINSGDKITIYRTVPLTQEYDLQDGSSIDPTALNTALDRTVAQSQQIQEEGERHITHPITDPTGLSYTTPTVAGRSGKALGWDANGNVVALNLADSGTISGNTNAGITVTNNQISAKVDDSSTEFDGSGNISIKDLGVATAHIAAGAVSNAKMDSDSVNTSQIVAQSVTYAKMQKVASALRVLGSVAGNAVPEEIEIETTLATTSATDNTVASAKSIKNYVDGTSSLIADDGYVNFSSGFQIRWGIDSVGATTSASVTLGTAFTNNCFRVICSFQGASTVIASACSAANFTKTGFDLYNSYAATRSISWIAIGN